MTQKCLKVISLADVGKNNTSESCWIVMEGKVYDVTKFLQEHPGGEEVITELAGKDATNAFIDVGHSKDAQKMTEDYIIGVLSEADNDVNPETSGRSKITNKPSVCSSLSDIFLSPTWSNFLIPTAIGIVVYVLYKGALKVLS